MSKIDCNITENYFKEKARMVRISAEGYCVIGCQNCPLSELNNKQGLTCRQMEILHPTKAIAIVQKWSDEHPVKTIKDDFLEKHPNAPKAATGTPLACAWRAGYFLDEDGCLSGRCTECWNRPLSEVWK